MNNEKCLEVFKEPQVAPFEYMRIGPLCLHNYLCGVCRERTAVLNTNTGILQPCWGCQKKGYKLMKLGLINKLLIKLGISNE